MSLYINQPLLNFRLIMSLYTVHKPATTNFNHIMSLYVHEPATSKWEVLRRPVLYTFFVYTLFTRYQYLQYLPVPNCCYRPERPGLQGGQELQGLQQGAGGVQQQTFNNHCHSCQFTGKQSLNKVAAASLQAS
jgi:hypothetical protein